MRVENAMETYLLDPTTDHLSQVQRAIREQDDYDPLVVVPGAGRDADPRGVLEEIRTLMPGALLSPRAHALMAQALDQIGDPAAARRERRIAELGMAAVLDSGTGSEERPYRVLRVQDEYDLLEARGRRPVAQREVEREGAVLDVHTFEDGPELWFELLWRRPA